MVLIFHTEPVEHQQAKSVDCREGDTREKIVLFLHGCQFLLHACQLCLDQIQLRAGRVSVRYILRAYALRPDKMSLRRVTKPSCRSGWTRQILV
jgi:hypothetical protein